MMGAKGALSALISAAVGALLSYFTQVAIPLAVLIFAMVLDYLTGMAKAWARRELSSRTGLAGLLKKVGYLGVVCVAGIIDWLLLYGLKSIGMEEGLPFLFALIVVVWLIINELISILENLHELGVPVPGFVMKLLERLKGSVEDKGGEQNDNPSASLAAGTSPYTGEDKKEGDDG